MIPQMLAASPAGPSMSGLLSPDVLGFLGFGAILAIGVLGFAAIYHEGTCDS